MLQRHAALAISLFALASAPARAENAAPKIDAEVVQRLTELVDKSGLGGGMGASVVEVQSGQRLYTLNHETPRNPASNMKLITAATALVELGPEHRLRTTLSGSIGDGGRVTTLVLRSEGDPSLAFSDLLAMAHRLVELGVREVEEVVVDGSYFDGAILPPAFEQQPKEVASFRAAVGGVSVDRNAFELRIAPGAALDQPAQVVLRCPEHFAVDSTVTTTAAGAPKIVADQKQVEELLSLKLSGSVPMGIRGVGYERRIELPLAYAGHCMRAALRSQQIKGALRTRVGDVTARAPVLVAHESAALSTLLQRVGKNSDNFYAEMLLKVIGAEATRRPGTSTAGIQRAHALLGVVGVDARAAQIVNGSGLFKGGAVTADALTKLLSHMYREPALRAEYVSQLAVGGKEGTLSARLADLKPARVVRAKTGTLDDVVALSGYVLGPTPERTLAFSFLVNGCSGKQWLARNLVDDMVRVLTAHLYRHPSP